jgi:hypothetical protein
MLKFSGQGVYIHFNDEKVKIPAPSRKIASVSGADDTV